MCIQGDVLAFRKGLQDSDESSRWDPSVPLDEISLAALQLFFVIHTLKSACNHKRLSNDCSVLRAVCVHWLSRCARVDAILTLVVIRARVLDINGLHRSKAQARCGNLTTRCIVGCTSA